MADTTINAESIRQKWSNKAYHRSMESSAFGPTSKFSISGSSKDGVVVEKQGDPGKAQTITYTLFEELSGHGVGTRTLRGHEEDIPNKATNVQTVWSRNATNIKKDQARIAAVGMYQEQYRTLSNWQRHKTEQQRILALASIKNDVDILDEEAGIGRTKTWFDQTITPNNGAAVTLTTTAAERNAFVTANSRRLFFGAENAGLVSGNWASSLANIAAGDTFNSAMALDVIHQAADEDWTNQQYRMDPLRETDFNEEHYLVLHSRPSFRNLRNDPTVERLYQESVSHSGINNNPYFKRGDIYYAGAIHREVQYIDKFIEPSLAGVGAGSIDLTCAFVCGRMGMVHGWGQATIMTNDNITDYGFEKPVGIESNYSIEKCFYGGEAYGVMPIFTAKV